jgi:hypothetical protein
MSQPSPRSPVGFTPREIRAFKIYALILAAVAGGIAVVAPKGLGQTMGALLAVALLPVPPLVIYLLRRGRGGS